MENEIEEERGRRKWRNREKEMEEKGRRKWRNREKEIDRKQLIHGLKRTYVDRK